MNIISCFCNIYNYAIFDIKIYHDMEEWVGVRDESKMHSWDTILHVLLLTNGMF